MTVAPPRKGRPSPFRSHLGIRLARTASRLAWMGGVGLAVALSLSGAVGSARAGEGGGVGVSGLRFNRDIRPIFAEHCLACHGPDPAQRKGGVRLDVRDEAMRPGKSGRPALVPGRPEESALWRRVTSADPDEVMPPPSTHRTLTTAEKDRLRRWIADGAQYEAHWAFLPPRRPAVPAVRARGWVRNPIDAFILARLEAERLKPSPEADRATWLRRVTLDLTGLPPTPSEADAFLADRAPGAEERVVDRLLQSPHYGERMAVDWLDAARFADSNGYQVDRDREMYAWRDWVIRAFNTNQPFDRFTIEQLAGDLLPGPTLQQRIATGFHRNHLMNEEGGIIPEEFLAEYCADRVETTATVWLGQTFNCARCHDHKYDPFTQRDFYGLYAFFHNVAEKGVGDYGASIRRNNPPMLSLPSPEQEAARARLKADQTRARESLERIQSGISASQAAWEQRVLAGPIAWTSVPGVRLLPGTNVAPAATLLPVGPGSGTGWVAVPLAAAGKQALTLELPSLPARAAALELRFTGTPWDVGGEASLTRTVSVSRVSLARMARPGAGATGTNGPAPWTLRAADGPEPGSVSAADAGAALDAAGRKSASVVVSAATPGRLIYELEPLGAGPVADARGLVTREAESGAAPLGLALTVAVGAPWTGFAVEVRWTDADPGLLVSPGLRAIVAKAAGQRTAEETKQLTEHRRARSAEHREWTGRLAALGREAEQLEQAIPTTLVMEELPQPRPTHVLIRGAYDRKGELVVAATPASLPGMGADLPRNRLGLARWLTDPANPLPARVTVNRFWQSFFGTGLVRTSEDFGVQGEPPSHPELLDWLAVDFVESGWDVKAFVRRIVTSATYRQSSKLTPRLRERDPENRLLARGPRYRLQAEFLRDQALAASGLLVRTIGGPSVRPYHPPGLYEQVVAGSGPSTYVVGKGDDLYRRSLYTYWKRSVPNPAMLLFDAPFREACAVRRPRTNTPLQALNLMNDPTFVEAARHLAARAMRDGGVNSSARLAQAFRWITARSPRPAELAVLEAALVRERRGFAADPAAARQLLAVGASRADASLDVVELAAYTMVAGTLLNLDEVVMKE